MPNQGRNDIEKDCVDEEHESDKEHECFHAAKERALVVAALLSLIVLRQCVETLEKGNEYHQDGHLKDELRNKKDTNNDLLVAIHVITFIALYVKYVRSPSQC